MKGIDPPTGSVVPNMCSWLEEWQNANVTIAAQPIQVVTIWSPLDEGWYKINFDRAFSVGDRVGGAGAVIRNERGEFMVAMTSSIPGAGSSDHVEAMAGLMALDVALSIGLNRIVLEGDAIRIIQAILSTDEDLSPIGTIIKDIKLKVRSFVDFTATHVKRDANTAAHRAARFALSSRDFSVWMEEPPIWLTDVLLQDSLSLVS